MVIMVNSHIVTARSEEPKSGLPIVHSSLSLKGNSVFRYAGYDSGYSGTGTQEDLDNHANQLNPNNDR